MWRIILRFWIKLGCPLWGSKVWRFLSCLWLEIFILIDEFIQSISILAILWRLLHLVSFQISCSILFNVIHFDLMRGFNWHLNFNIIRIHKIRRFYNWFKILVLLNSNRILFVSSLNHFCLINIIICLFIFKALRNRIRNFFKWTLIFTQRLWLYSWA